MKPLQKAVELFLALGVLMLTTLGSRAQTNIFVSREYSVFEFNQSPAPNGVEGISREYSLFQFNNEPATSNGVEGISREFSLFEFNQPSAPNGIESISREVSGYNYGSNLLNVAVGSTVVRAGASGGVPVTLSTIVPMSNVMVAVDFPPTLLSNWTVQAEAPYAGSLLVSNNSRLYLTFSNATMGQTIESSNQVLGQIRFASASNQPSAFLPLPVAGVTPTLVNANAFAPSRTTVGNGEVVVVYTNSLLRLSRGTNSQGYLTLYGLDGTNYTIESATNLSPPINWQTAYTGLTPVNLMVVTPGLGTTNPAMFFRAWQ